MTIARLDPIARINAIARMFGDANEHVATTALGRYRSTLKSSGLHPEDIRIEDARGADYSRDRRLIDGMKVRIDDLQRRLWAYEQVATPEQRKEAARIAKVRNLWPECLAILKRRWPEALPTDKEIVRLLGISASKLAAARVGTFQLTKAMMLRATQHQIPPPRTKKRKEGTPNAAQGN